MTSNIVPIRPGERTPDDLMPSNAELIAAASTIVKDQVEELVLFASKGTASGYEATQLAGHAKSSIDVLTTLKVGTDARAIKDIRDEVSRQLAALRSGQTMQDIPSRDGIWVGNWIAHLDEGYWRRVTARDALMKKHCPIAACDL